MVLKEIIQRVKSLYSKGVESDDLRLSNRHIYNKLKSVRSLLLVNKLNKKQFISSENYQILYNIELESVNKSISDCYNSVDCNILKSKKKIPSFLSDSNEVSIKYVSSVDLAEMYSEISAEGNNYKKGNKYTSNIPTYYIQDNYLYLTGNNLPETVAMSALFEDPVEVKNFNSETKCEDNEEQDCNSNLEIKFPIEPSLTESLIKIAIEELVLLFSQAKEDRLNNSQDDNSINKINTVQNAKT